MKIQNVKIDAGKWTSSDGTEEKLWFAVRGLSIERIGMLSLGYMDEILKAIKIYMDGEGDEVAVMQQIFQDVPALVHSVLSLGYEKGNVLPDDADDNDIYHLMANQSASVQASALMAIWRMTMGDVAASKKLIALLKDKLTALSGELTSNESLIGSKLTEALQRIAQ